MAPHPPGHFFIKFGNLGYEGGGVLSESIVSKSCKINLPKTSLPFGK